jgi:hypothetical protein
MKRDFKAIRERLASSQPGRSMARFMTDQQTAVVVDFESHGVFLVAFYFSQTVPGQVAVQMRGLKSTGFNLFKHQFNRAVVYPDGSMDYFGSKKIKLRGGY